MPRAAFGIVPYFEAEISLCKPCIRESTQPLETFLQAPSKMVSDISLFAMSNFDAITGYNKSLCPTRKSRQGYDIPIDLEPITELLLLVSIGPRTDWLPWRCHASSCRVYGQLFADNYP